MDGLDEVDDEYRAALAALLNATYLRAHPKSVVVVCSRINEYKSLQEDEAASLEMRGSITLQPLTRSQIPEYLDKFRASGLRETLFRDDTLYQIAQTPLMLSMLTLVYSGVEVGEVPSSGSSIDRRHQLMERYVDRMVRRKIRRDRRTVVDNNMVVGNNPENDDVSVEEYSYAPERLNHYLGWLAVRLSVRMQTAFSVDRMSSFLQREIGRDQWFGIWWAGVFARAPLIAVLTIIAGVAVAPMDRFSWQLVILLGLSGTLIYPVMASSFRSEPSGSVANKTAHAVYRIVQLIVMVTVGLAAFAGGPAVSAIALSQVLPAGIPTVVVGTTAACLAIFIAGLIGWATGEPKPERSFLVTCTAAIVVLETGWLCFHAAHATAWDWYILCGILAGFQILFFAYQVAKDEAWWAGVIVLVVLPAIPFLFAPLVEFLKPIAWYQPLAVFVLICLFILRDSQQPFLFLGGLVATFLLGAAIQQATGAMLGLTAYGVAAAAISAVDEGRSWDKDFKPGIFGRIKKSVIPESVGAAEDFVERYWISPVLFPVLAIMRSLPFRFDVFANYAIDSMLLKRSGRDIEFMHRLLRDYFALRDLQPLLASNDLQVRLQAIRSLGFQGDAAIAALADFVRDKESAEVREAAVSALGRIASPEVLQHIEAAMADDVAEVRASAVRSTGNLLEADRRRLIGKVVLDESVLVQHSLVEWALEDKGFYYWVSDFRGDFSPSDPLWKVMQNIEQRRDLRAHVRELISNNIDKGFSVLQAHAVHTVGKFKDTDAVPVLIELIKGGDDLIRDDAAKALGKIGDKSAVRTLMLAANDQNESVRRAVREALSELGYSAPLPEVPRGMMSRLFGLRRPEGRDGFS